MKLKQYLEYTDVTHTNHSPVQPRNHTHTCTCVVKVAGNVTVILDSVVYFPLMLKEVCLEGIPILHFFFAKGTSHRILVVVAACNERLYCFISWSLEYNTKSWCLHFESINFFPFAKLSNMK